MDLSLPETQSVESEKSRQQAIRTESDLFSLVGWENEGDEGEQRDDGTRDDEVEAVVETQTSNVYDERDVEVRVGTTLVLQLVSIRRHLYTRQHHHRTQYATTTLYCDSTHGAQTSVKTEISTGY